VDAPGVGGLTADHERVGGGFTRGSLRGVVDPASAEGTGVAPSDAHVHQPNREHVLTGSTQRAEYQADAGEPHAATMAGDGVDRDVSPFLQKDQFLSYEMRTSCD